MFLPTNMPDFFAETMSAAESLRLHIRLRNYKRQTTNHIENELLPPGFFKCSKCNNNYSNVQSLRRHMRFECGIEPQFKCPYCNKKAKHKHNLILHMRTHEPKQK